MGYLLITVQVLFLLATFDAGNTKPTPTDEDWWKHAVFYQIYPRSFKDSDGDGIGDLQGIISKLDYLKETGVTAVWLSPFYKSPQSDMGYDISDHKDVDPLFGTLDDFDQLISEAHERDLKVVLDFVPNHTSKTHEWFEKSESSDGDYEDYYLWRNASDNGSYPNNWVSVFHGAAWTWSDRRQQYYLHQFSAEQPDLNFRNPKVLEEMEDVLTFWLDRGVDGFRVDAVAHIYEHEEFLDEPSAEGSEGFYEQFDHIYTKDQPETYEFVHKIRELLDNYVEENGGDKKVIMTEAYTDIAHTVKYYGNDTSSLGAQIPFNFQFVTNVAALSHMVNAVDNWYSHMPKGFVPNWVLGNHDVHRTSTRFGPSNVDGYNMLLLLLPGIAITYNGEEIGMEDGEVAFGQCADPPACVDEETFKRVGRDAERTPFQWDSSKNAGFSDADETWLPVSGKYLETNVEVQKDDETSHYNIYRELVKLRQEPAFSTNEKPEMALISENTLAFVVGDEERYVVLFNNWEKSESFDLNNYFKDELPFVEVVLVSSNSSFEKGSVVTIGNMTLPGHESLVGKFVEMPQETTPSMAAIDEVEEIIEVVLNVFNESDASEESSTDTIKTIKSEENSDLTNQDSKSSNNDEIPDTPETTTMKDPKKDEKTTTEPNYKVGSEKPFAKIESSTEQLVPSSVAADRSSVWPSVEITTDQSADHAHIITTMVSFIPTEKSVEDSQTTSVHPEKLPEEDIRSNDTKDSSEVVSSLPSTSSASKLEMFKLGIIALLLCAWIGD